MQAAKLRTREIVGYEAVRTKCQGTQTHQLAN